MVDPAQAETEIELLLAKMRADIHRKDLDALMECYVADVTAFDLSPPLVIHGTDEYRHNWQRAFDMTDGPFDVQFHDLVIHASEDVAFVHAFDHVQATAKSDGKKIDMWIRISAGLRRIDGHWKIVHDHGSVPIDMTSDKPLWDLKPDRLAA